MKLSREEAWVLGVLVERQFETPEDPAVTQKALQERALLDLSELGGADPSGEWLGAILRQLVSKKLVGRARCGWFGRCRYAQLLGGGKGAYLSVTQPELALLGGLLLYGPSSPAELFATVGRWYPFKSEIEVLVNLNQLLRLSSTPLVHLLPFEAGQSQQRYTHLFEQHRANSAAQQARKNSYKGQASSYCQIEMHANLT